MRSKFARRLTIQNSTSFLHMTQKYLISRVKQQKQLLKMSSQAFKILTVKWMKSIGIVYLDESYKCIRVQTDWMTWSSDV